jgi:hypothetical protein
MSAVNRRSVLIALAARYPDLPRLAARGATRERLQATIRVPLEASDIAILASIREDEVRAVACALHRPSAATYPYGI